MPRGRPTLYHGDDALCVEMARRVLSVRAKTAWAAAMQLEKECPDSVHRAPESIARRLYRKYKLNQDWYLMRAKIRPVMRKRRRSGLGAFLDSMRTTQQIVDEYTRQARQFQQIVDERNRSIEQLRQFERLAGLPDPSE